MIFSNKLIILFVTIFTIFVISFMAFADLYVGGSLNGSYIPEEKFEFKQWLYETNTTFSLSDQEFKNKGSYGIGGSLVVGKTFDDYFNFEFEFGIDQSEIISIKDSSLKTSTTKSPNTLTPNSIINGKDFTKSNITYLVTNGTYFFNMKSLVKPYIGIGGGFGYYRSDFSESNFGNDTKIYSYNGNDTIILDYILHDTNKGSLMFNVMSGIDVKLNKRLGLNIGYKMISGFGQIGLEDKVNLSNIVRHQYLRHSITIGGKVFI